LQQISHFFLSIVDHAGYPGLFVVMVLGNMGIPVGAELVVPAAGALAATGHLSSAWLAGLVATLGEVVGGTLLYAIGYAGGRPFVTRYGKYIKVDEKRLDMFDEFYGRHGNVVVFVCRFLPLVRGFSALPAGVSRMPKLAFVAYTAAGSAVFCFGLVWLGNVFGHHFAEIAPLIHRTSTGFIVALLFVVVVAVAVGVVRSRRKANQTL
jgi:membrane protein DedA with SNARE-associated domain